MSNTVATVVILVVLGLVVVFVIIKITCLAVKVIRNVAGLIIRKVAALIFWAVTVIIKMAALIIRKIAALIIWAFQCNKKGSSSDNQKGSSSDNQKGSSSDNQKGSSSDNQKGSSSDNQKGSSSDNQKGSSSDNPRFHKCTSFQTLTMDKFLNDMEREKPIRFTSQQLEIATDNFTNLLGSGGFGTVYKGIFSDGTLVAVKVLNGTSDKRIEEQFMAEVSTLGRIHHFNLVRLYGFCFERHLRALVYEYMSNGSLDKFLFDGNKMLGFEKLHDIAVRTARGIAYLHEECQQRIVHYDIKPGNILLDVNFFPKVADFGLAKLCNRDNTHITMTAGRGTPGYAAPEIWMRLPITHKCDVYSFGMLLFEIIGRRRNLDLNLPESQDWFPRWGWNKFEAGELGELMLVCGIEEKDKKAAERMVKVALWCVQYMPELRPLMSVVVKMLEGEIEIPRPSINPFPQLMPGTPIMAAYSTSDFDKDSTRTITGYSYHEEIEIEFTSVG